MNVSVIICTRNRANSLAQTLESLDVVSVPPGLRPEIVVVDNGSTDHTAEIVRRHSAVRIPVRYILESSPGLSRARNAGVAAGRGDVILFTDDDVVPDRNWLEQITAPLLGGKCEGIAGRVVLAKEVCRSWMTETQKGGLASFDGPGNGPVHFVGANMGVHRSVFDRVPGFDPELGAGALGMFEDTLFSWQLSEAGFRLRYVPEASVIHYPDPSRLKRRHCLSSGRSYGASMGYLLHHWFHERFSAPSVRHYYVALKLRLRCLIEPPPALEAEGIAPWEMSYVGEMEKCRQYLIESRRPRNYSKRGLRKRDA